MLMNEKDNKSANAQKELRIYDKVKSGYDILGVYYDDVERDGLDKEIEEAYKQKKSKYQTLIDSIYDRYKVLPDKVEELKEIDIVQALKDNGEEVDFSDIKIAEKKCKDIDNAVKSLISLKGKLLEIETIYRRVKTVCHRLALKYTCEKKEKSCTIDLIKKVEEKKVYEGNQTTISYGQVISNRKSDVDLGNGSIMKHIGKLEYTNASNVYESYINKYSLEDGYGKSQIIYTDIPDEYKHDLKFIEFLNKIMLNKDYISYAIANNNGFLGIPTKREDGNYTLEFCDEDIMAVEKYYADKKKDKKIEDDFIL